jgi:hypothetical protein
MFADPEADGSRVASAVGDTYPLCDTTHSPRGAFLRRGARFIFFNSSFVVANADPVPGELLITAGSALYRALCGAAPGICVLQSVVTLSAPIACISSECEVDTVTTVRLVSRGQNIW